MPGPVLESKIRVPRRRDGAVARPRLDDRLARGARSRLTLVSAPAGFGKTTAMADWLASAPADVSRAWLSLDARDNDEAVFWRYVVAALESGAPGIAAATSRVMDAGDAPLDVVLATLVNELTAWRGDVVLVLDDVHVIEAPQVRDQVTFLLEHLPAHVHLMIGTRADPALPVARLRASGELVEIRAADLRFTPLEAAAYLEGSMGLTLEPQHVATLEARTEGWIAALQLAALSLQGRDDVAGFIEGFAGDDRFVVDYLVEEVLQRQGDLVRSFLLQTSILGRLDGSLCDAVTGRADGASTLDAIDRSNLFLVPLDDHRQWYRYHHLFADVLRARLLAERPADVPVLHRRASAWHEAHGSLDDAIRHTLLAHDADRAADLMERAVPAIRRLREEATLRGWLEALPDDVLRRSPVLSVFAGYMLMTAGDLDGFEARLDDAERALAAVPEGSQPPGADTVELRTLPATIAVYRASIAQARGDVAATAAHARRALDLAGPTDHLARGSASGFLGLVAWARGDVAEAIETFTQAVASLHAAGNRVDELTSSVVLADMWLVAGRPSTARRSYERALRAAQELGQVAARAVPDLHVGIVELDVEAGDLEAAHERLATAATLAEGTAPTEGRYRWFVARARIASVEGDAEGAIGLLDEAVRLYRPGFFPDVRPLAALEARVRIADGDLSEASRWADERGVSATDEARYLSEFDHLTLVRLLLARHRVGEAPDAPDQALGLLSRLGEAADASGRGGSLMEIRVLEALAYDALGRREQALESLARAWSQVPEPEGYARLLLDEGAPMVALLRACERGAARDHARRVLSLVRAPAPEAPDPARRAPTLPADQLSERELQVLRLLDSDLSGPQIARELFVTVNTLRSHTKRIFTKLGVTSRRAAVTRARECGVI